MMCRLCAMPRTIGRMPEPISPEPLAGLVLRRGRPEDAAALARVHVESWRAAYAGLLPDRYLVEMSFARWAGFWAELLSRRSAVEPVFVADVQQFGVVGFCTCGRIRQKGWPRRLWRGGEVYTLYVDPDHQGCGYGRALLQRALKHLRDKGASVAVVWVLAGNPARFFYEALGARHVAARGTRFAGRPVQELGYAWEWADPRQAD